MASSGGSSSSKQGPKSPTRNLPGFLRRSLRMNYSDDAEDTTTTTTAQRESSTTTSWAASAAEGEAASNKGTSNGNKPSTTTTTTRQESSSTPRKKDAEEKSESSATASDETVTSIEQQQQQQTQQQSSSSSSSWQQVPRPPPEQPLERAVSYKQAMFEKTISADVVSMSELRKLSWNGIPTEHRAQAWKLMLGYVPVNSTRRTNTLQRKRAEYRDAIAQHYDIDDDTRTLQEQETLRQVLVDVPRTAPDVGLFRNGRIRKSLGRLLYIWAMRHPASSYVQGINDLATPLVCVFLSDMCNGRDVMDGSIMEEVTDSMLRHVEADCYWCLTNLLAVIQDHYTSDQPGVQRMVMRLEELVTRIDADLSAHLRDTGIEFMQFAFKWMNCLLLREFNLQCVIRLWDTYISEGDKGFEDFHVYVCAAFLCQFSSQLQAMEFDELFGFMQHIPTDTWTDTEIEILLSQAYVLSTLFRGSDAHLTSMR